MNGNTTYNSRFRLKALLAEMDEQHRAWQRREPTHGMIANAVETWRRTVENLGYQRDIPRQLLAATDMSLQEAWEDRLNRQNAVKAVGKAVLRLSQGLADAEEYADTPRPRPAIKSAVYANESTEDALQRRVKAVRQQLQTLLLETQTTTQRNHRQILKNPRLEGQYYQQSAARVKSWLTSDAAVQTVLPELTLDSQTAIREIDNKLETIYHLAHRGALDTPQRRAIQQHLREAYDLTEQMRPAPPEAPSVKAAVFTDFNTLRQQLDRLGPLLENNTYEEQDLFEDVTALLQRVKSITAYLPLDRLPQDTTDNLENFGQALIAMLQTPVPHYRVKALTAAAANLEVIVTDMARLQQRETLEQSQRQARIKSLAE